MQQNLHRRALISTLYVLAAFLLVPATALSEIYKWVDDKGRTHYSEKPPTSSNSKPLSIKQPAIQPSDSISQQEHKNRQQNLLRAFEEERLQRESNRVKARQDQEKRNRQCASARNRLRIVEGGYRLYDFDKQGNRVYLNAQDIDRERAKAAQRVKRLCK